jgi:epoxide hydrolase
MADPAQPDPFRVEIPQGDLDDLKDRLARTRWPDQLDGAAWTYGVPLDYVRQLVDYWIADYDWRTHEARLNEHPQFVTTIDNQRLHFLHVRSPSGTPCP